MNNLPNCPKCNSEYVYEDGALGMPRVCVWMEPSWGRRRRGCRSDWRQRKQIGWWRWWTWSKIWKWRGPKIWNKERVKNIRIVEGDHNIDCKIDGFGAMKLKSEFVKKILKIRRKRKGLALFFQENTMKFKLLFSYRFLLFILSVLVFICNWPSMVALAWCSITPFYPNMLVMFFMGDMVWRMVQGVRPRLRATFMKGQWPCHYDYLCHLPLYVGASGDIWEVLSFGKLPLSLHRSFDVLSLIP